jgi:Na+/H+ antiporter NhaD/arsenite permease-like protein
METTTMRSGPAALRSRWTLPVFCLLIGAAFLVAQWIGGDLGGGLVSLAIMAAVGALFLLGGRWDAIRQLRADTQDERGAAIDLRATAFAGIVVIVLVIVGFVATVARGEDPTPYALIGAAGGAAYVAALAWLRRRY